MAKKPMLPLSPALSATGGVIDLGPGSTGPKWNHKKMNWDPISPLPTKEIQKRLTNLENGGNQVNRPTVTKIGDQYQLEANTVYTAYASALLNLSSAGKIINQSDASTFQLTPYDALGVLLPFRGYFENNSIYQSGDPTDYTWESTLEDEGFGFSERYFTDSAELVDRLGNPTKPLNSTVWTPLAASVAVPASAAFFAQRFNTSNTSGSVSSPWKINPVGKYIDTGVIADNSITNPKMADNSINTTEIIDNAVTNDKMAIDSVDSPEIVDGSVDDIHLATGITATKLIGPLPAIDGSALTNLPSADANTTTKSLYEMVNIISVNYSITSGNNAISAGPITINTNISVTVPSGSTWVIL
jgi:hypothetical protein